MAIWRRVAWWISKATRTQAHARARAATHERARTHARARARVQKYERHCFSVVSGTRLTVALYVCSLTCIEERNCSRCALFGSCSDVFFFSSVAFKLWCRMQVDGLFKNLLSKDLYFIWMCCESFCAESLTIWLKISAPHCYFLIRNKDPALLLSDYKHKSHKANCNSFWVNNTSAWRWQFFDDTTR